MFAIVVALCYSDLISGYKKVLMKSNETKKKEHTIDSQTDVDISSAFFHDGDVVCEPMYCK